MSEENNNNNDNDLKYTCPKCGFSTEVECPDVKDPAELLDIVQHHTDRCLLQPPEPKGSRLRSPPLKGGAFIIGLIFALIAGNMIHESGHMLYCLSAGGTIDTDFFTFTDCSWKPVNAEQLAGLFYFGGFFAAGIAAIALMIGRKWFTAHKEYMFGAVVLLVTHTFNGIIEGANPEYYNANWQLLGPTLYLLGLFVAIGTVFRHIIKEKMEERRFNKLQKKEKLEQLTREFDAVKDQKLRELMPDHAEAVAKKELETTFPVDPSQSQKPTMWNKMLQGIKKSLDEDINRWKKEGRYGYGGSSSRSKEEEDADERQFRRTRRSWRGRRTRTKNTDTYAMDDDAFKKANEEFNKQWHADDDKFAKDRKKWRDMK